MKVKKWPLLLFIWLILSLLGCVFLWRNRAAYVYQHPILIMEDDQYTVVVDDNDQTTNVLQLDRNNRVVSRISYDRVDRTSYHMAWQIFYSEGTWYLVDFYNYLSDTNIRFSVYSLDFGKGTMSLAYGDFYALIQQTAKDYGLTVAQFHGRNYRVQDGALFVQIGGYNSGAEEYYCLTFRIQNETCTLEKTVPVQGIVWGMATLGDESLSVFTNKAGLYAGEQCLSEDYYNILATSRDGTVYALNQTRGRAQRVTPVTGSLTSDPEFSLNQLSQYGLSLSGITDLDLTDEQNFAAAYFDLDTPRILLQRDGTLEIYSSSELTPIPLLLIWCVLLIFALGLAEMFVVLLVQSLWRRGSVAAKLLAALLPIMVLITACSTWLVSTFLARYNDRQTQEVLETIAREVAALGIHRDAEAFVEQYPLQSGRIDDPETRQAYNNFRGNIDLITENVMEQPMILDADTQQVVANQMRCQVQYCVRNPQTGTYYNVGSTFEFLPFDGWMTPGQSELFWDKLLQDSQEVFDYYYYTNQKVSGLIYPTRSETGEITGFYLITVDLIEGDSQIAQIIQRFMLYQLSLCLLLLALTIPIAFFSLKPLSALRGKVRQLSNGTIPIFTPLRGSLRNEITDLDETFRRLVGQVDDNLKRMNRLQELSKAYFYPKILRLLGKSSVSNLTFHETATCPMYVAYLAMGEKSFEEVQQLVNRCIPLLESCDGFFASITGEEMVLAAQNPDLFYMAAAVAQEGKGLRAVFDYAPVTVKISGWGTEYRILVAPENENRKNALCAYRDALGRRLLAMEQAVPADQTDLNWRIVGYLDGQALVEFFLDAFANQYRLGQKDLERGVQLFFQGTLSLARNSFIQALRFHPGDPVALYYIQLIDAQQDQLQKGEGS